MGKISKNFHALSQGYRKFLKKMFKACARLDIENKHFQYITVER